ncbi:ABC transporter permease [Paenibacillus sp. J5C_2022]|uniref:ABC transporter permease n=1 Tax=Paenibacillus sp. J5C2022 TaxID=2977129 RepID=UPI0021CFC232|nr:ABC transporter permease [Paenibacillus sp. J5C2022]MCU6712267.1 ABC transporter permease [Paenibacillus sp. J5C2022]
MIGRAIRADLLKIRGKGLWFLVFLAPVGLIAMQALNYGLRYDYMMDRYGDDPWRYLLENIAMFVPIALLMGITILASMLANIEHHTSAWKQLLALPVSRYAVFGAKFFIIALLLAVSCLLLAIGTVPLGLALKFGGTDIPYAAIAKLAFFPYIATWPVLAFVLWMCVTYRNQSLPITIGVVMAVLSIFPISEYLPLNWPLAAFKGPHEGAFLGAGLLCGFILLLLGSIHFNRKDVS